MQVTEDLFPIATSYNVTVIFIGYSMVATNVNKCFTILPLHAPPIENQPSREICIAHLK